MAQITWLSKTNKFVVDGARLTAARIKADMSLEKVAKALGCNKSSVSRWEQGKLQPSQERIRKMTEMFGTQEFVIANPKNASLGKELLKDEAEG